MRFEDEYKKTMNNIIIPKTSAEEIMGEGRHKAFVRQMKKRTVLSAVLICAIVAALGGTGAYAASVLAQRAIDSDGKGRFAVDGGNAEDSTYTIYSDDEWGSEQDNSARAENGNTTTYLSEEEITYTRGEPTADDKEKAYSRHSLSDGDTGAKENYYSSGSDSTYDDSAYRDRTLYRATGYNDRRTFNSFADAEAAVPYGIFNAGDSYTYSYTLPVNESNRTSYFTGTLKQGGKTVNIQQAHYTAAWSSGYDFSSQSIIKEFDYTTASGITWKVAETEADSGKVFHAEAATAWDDITADFTGYSEKEVEKMLDTIDLAELMR